MLKDVPVACSSAEAKKNKTNEDELIFQFVILFNQKKIEIKPYKKCIKQFSQRENQNSQANSVVRLDPPVVNLKTIIIILRVNRAF